MKRLIFIFALFLFVCPYYSAASGPDNHQADTALYRLTLYVMKSIKPIIWDSPASLIKSVKKGYVSQICRRNQYLLGHLVVKLEAPESRHPVYTGMASSSKKEKRKLVMKEKVGLGILGAGMQGHLETGDTVTAKLKKYARMGKVAFIRYLISEEAFSRISVFLDEFRGHQAGGFSPSSVYGGIFWPRYENEGAGCTAYGMAILDLAGILGEEQKNWKVDVNIPVNLIGGAFNDGAKVRTKSIRHTGSWYAGSADSLGAFIPFGIYDPGFMYDWVMKKREAAGDHVAGGYIPVMEQNIPGVISDRRSIRPPAGEPVFLKRTQPSVFIDVFNKTRIASGQNN